MTRVENIHIQKNEMGNCNYGKPDPKLVHICFIMQGKEPNLQDKVAYLIDSTSLLEFHFKNNIS